MRTKNSHTWLHRGVSSALILLLIAAHEQDVVMASVRGERQLTWAQAAALVPGYQLEILLPDGERVWGRALSAGPDSLRMNVEWTSNRSLHPKGPTVISSSLLSLIKLRRPGRTPKGDRGEEFITVRGVAFHDAPFLVRERPGLD